MRLGFAAPLLALASLTALALPVAEAAHVGAYTWPTGGNPCGTSRNVDVLFVFDTTGSMGGVITSAKSGASSIMSNVLASLPGTQFAVADYKDYPSTFSYPGYASTYGGAGDYPWRLRQPVTASTGAVNTAINGLSASGGADWPESVVRAVYETYSDGAIGWRAGSIRVAVFFGDAPGHDADFAGYNFGGDPGRNGAIGGGDDLDFQAVVAAAAAAGMKLGIVQNGADASATAYFNHMASSTGGIRQSLSGTFVSQVTNMILTLAPPPPQPKVYAKAFPLSATVSSPAFGYRPVETTIGYGTGHAEDAILDLTLPPALNGFVEVATAESLGVGASNLARATGMSEIEEVSILGGTVVVRALHAEALAQIAAGGAPFATVAGSHLAYVKVGGVVVPLTGAPQTIPLPGGVGEVRIWETAQGTTTGTAWAWINLVHVIANVGGTSVDVILGHAFASATCKQGIPDPTPPPPPPCLTPPLPGLRPVCIPRVDVDTPLVPGLPAPPVADPCDAIAFPTGLECDLGGAGGSHGDAAAAALEPGSEEENAPSNG